MAVSNGITRFIDSFGGPKPVSVTVFETLRQHKEGEEEDMWQLNPPKNL